MNETRGAQPLRYMEVPRPLSLRDGKKYPIAAIAATLDTDKAIRIELGGTTRNAAQWCIRKHLMLKGLVIHCRKDPNPDYIICWVDRPRKVAKP